MREMWVARAARLIAIAHRLSGSRPVRMWLAGILAALIVAGCSTGATSSPSVAATASPTDTASVPASPTASAMPSSNATLTPPLTFVATGSMHAARGEATAILLKNGSVLVAGGVVQKPGVDDQDFYASAELYDPTTGQFTSTGSMSAARADASAVILADGRVLIAGGEGCQDGQHCTDVSVDGLPPHKYGPLASAEIYDPTSGKFTRTGSMTQSGQHLSATLLGDGKVLVAGLGSGADLYDPARGQFTATVKVSDAGETATLLPSGQVLLTGASLTEAHVYDEPSGKFSTVSIALPAGTQITNYEDLGISAATLLLDGRVLFFENGYLETYDPASGACTYDGSISPGVDWIFATATLRPDGQVLYEGGKLVAPVTYDSPNTKTAVLYDPAKRSFRTGSTQVARSYQTATLLQDGAVLITGGHDDDLKPIGSAELFKP